MLHSIPSYIDKSKNKIDCCVEDEQNMPSYRFRNRLVDDPHSYALLCLVLLDSAVEFAGLFGVVCIDTSESLSD